MPSLWFRVALGNFFIAALLGLTLRFAFIQEIPFFNYKNILHAHSHVAMLGWLYLGLYGLVVTFFVPKEKATSRFYRRLFWLSQISVLGMLFSFPFQGYGPVSISFSTLHIFCAYTFAANVWMDSKATPGFSRLLLRSSLAFMVLSTFGVWSMGPLMALGFKHSIWYHLAVQFFLHFQFNGWFIIAVLALFFQWMEQKGHMPSKTFRGWFYGLLIGAAILTFALAVAWSEPHPLVFACNSIGVLLQLSALVLLLQHFWPILSSIKAALLPVQFRLWQLSLLSLCFKIVVQAAVALPIVAQMAYTIRNYIIGFIHLMMLGILSFFILGIQYGQSSSLSKNQSWGLIALGSGIIGSEALLFLQGTLFWAGWGFMPGYYLLLFGVSALMPIGVGLLLVKSG
ncbi:hypothetical protein [Haliscomenobacter sp.]|uniref:hypothetical protein n=1 Tax=Haliscomenobacter sp. TaxID=2717303 RepID=UPI003BA8E0E1